MPTLTQLRGLRASDRSIEEQLAINQQMGYQEELKPINMPIQNNADILADQMSTEPQADTTSAAAINQALRYKQHLDEQYQQVLAEREEQYGVNRNTVNSTANDYLDSIANNASSYYKKFKNTDKLPLDDNEKKQLSAEYDARKQTYGEQNADIWLDKYFKDKVGQNQSWWEQATHAVSHLIPAIEGGLIQTYGMLHGAIAHAIGAEGYDSNPDLNWWDSFINDVIDNPVTRYGRDIEMAGASHLSDALNLVGLSDQTANESIAAMKETATKYNPEGIGNDAIVTANEQDEYYFNATTPWQALQSGGFTALSMITGAAEAKAAGWLFGKLAQGANWLNKTGRLIKTEKGLEKTLEGLKKAQNFTDIAVIPGAVGSVEGALEGLNTKIEVERDAVGKLDDFYKDKITKEAQELFNSEELNPMEEVQTDQGKIIRRRYTPDEAFQAVWDKYKDEYNESRRQIDWASSKAGIHNFYANSMINGMINTTLKAGLMAPRVQETLRNSKMFGWAYRNPKFNIDDAGNVTAKTSKLGAIKQVLKEPFGEGTEEYLQSLSSDVFSSAAENNIDEFIKNKFDGDGTAKVTDSFGSDYAAALTALGESLTNKESIESAILGAVSSSMGTVGMTGRGYHRDENGNIVRNSFLDPRNLTRSIDVAGNQESWEEYARRVTPWRSGLINAYYDARREQAEANETAATLTEWLKDPQNKAKWDGLTGTASWMNQMEHAAESNDQFSYRKAQMGKAINDVFMLSKLKGTSYYDSVIQDLQRASSMDVSSQETQDMIQQMRQNGGEDYHDKSDEEIVEKIKSNANRMLGLMTTVEQEGRQLDRMLGRIDEDTKQSLIFGKIMEDDFTKRRDQLQEEIDTIKGRIQNSKSRSSVSLDDDLKNLILQYGTLNKALKAQEQLQQQKEKTQQKIEQLEAIDPEKTSDKQKEELVKSKLELKKINRQLEGFKGLYNEDGQIDSSLAQLVLNEEEIMSLDTVTRAMVLAQGANRLYNATHQNRQKVDQLNLEIDEINHQIEELENQNQSWTKPDGGIKKGHNKQYERNDKKIAELQKQKDAKMRALDAEQGRMDSKPVYNSAQQTVIDNLVQQGMAQDPDFLDKIVDIGRLEKGIKDYHTQYQAVLSDPRAFQNYVQRAKYNAQKDLTRRRAERIANIQDYKEFVQELDRLTANASQQEMNEIMQTLREVDARQKKAYQENNMVVDENTGDLVAPTEQPKTNLDRYMDNMRQQGDLVRQFAKNPNLTDNDQSLLLDAMQYLSSNGIDITDREAAVQALIEKDEAGNIGGKFRQFVEAKNDMMPEQQRAFMPQFTSIGQIASQYVELLNGTTQDAVNRGNIKPTVTLAPSNAVGQQPTVVSNPSPNSSSPLAPAESHQPEGPSLLTGIYNSADGGQLTDANGTVATDSQTNSMQQQQAKLEVIQKSALQQAFEQVTTEELAQTVDAATDIIANSNISDEAKQVAMQYLEEIAVNGNETFSTIDDILTAMQEQVERLKAMSDQQEEDNNKYSSAAGALQKMYGLLNAKKIRGRGRTLPMPSSVPVNPRAAWIHTANIAWMEKNNPDAWAVVFTNDHAIDEWNRENIIERDTPVYFITDSDWTAEVTRQMTPTAEMLSINPNTRKYDTLTDMPIVAAVRVEAPANPATTTAIEVGSLWYQPIGVMPSTKAKSGGAEMTEAIRKNASKEQGRHLVTADGMPNGKPLTTRVFGKNYLTAHHPDAVGDTNRQNTVDTNSEVQDAILRTLTRDSEDRLRALSKEEMLNDPEYRDARNKFLNGLGWGTNKSYPDNIAYTPNNRRDGETGNPMLVFVTDMAETKGRTTDMLLPEVLENGTGGELRVFNSRTQRLYDEVIRPIFQFIQYNPVSKSGDKEDRSARIITQDDLTADPESYQKEAERLTNLLNGYEKGAHGVGDFINIKKNTGWSIKVTAPEALQTAGDLESSQAVYKVFFVNQDASIEPIEIGTINAGQKDTDAAFELLRNLMWDSNTGQVRDFLNWQTPKTDAQNINNPDAEASRRPRQNYAAIVDDGILQVAGSSIVYDVDGVKLYAPISSSGRIIYQNDTVTNPTNAQPAAPANITPQGSGTVNTTKGQQLDPDNGAVLSGTSPKPKEKGRLVKAQEITAKIVADSKEFTLSDDEVYYYITDKTTGEQIKYLRVTTVIGADEHAPQWDPTLAQIYNKLREKHDLADMPISEMAATFKSTKEMSAKLGIPAGEIRRAVAELRTEHKKEKYGAWGTPSTAIGNTADIITRDFLAGNLKEEYPNITEEALGKFVHQLELFKSDLDANGIHIVPEGVMAHGKITMTDAEGTSHDVNVAGTLDLFGYDGEGNFYIFDMKTTRDHGADKLKKEQDKWSRQISMYADLLKQSYPGFEINHKNLRIIPINVDYPTPMGSRSDHLDPNGPKYSITNTGQLIMTKRGNKKGQPTNGQDLTTRSQKPTDAAKIQKISENLKSLAENVKDRTEEKGFLTDLTDALGAEVTGASRYANFVLSDGTTLSVRVSNHNANAANYKDGKARDENISIVIKPRRRRNTFRGDEEIPLTEYVYFRDNLNGTQMSQIVHSIANALETGVYEDTTGLARINYSGEKFVDSNIQMRTTSVSGQFKPGYTPFSISWDNLSSEDQDIADALATQTGDSSTSTGQTLQNVKVDTPAQQRPSFIAGDTFVGDYSKLNNTAQAPPVTPAGEKPVLPSWKNLTSIQKQILSDTYGIDNVEDYNELLNDPATAEGIAQDLGCKKAL